MERYTRKHASGRNIVDADYIAFANDHEPDEYAYGEPLDRLASYEDTGLEPSEVAELVEDKACGRLVEVVRCRDCVKRKTPDCSMWFDCDCGAQGTWEVDDDFCSVGVTRAEAEAALRQKGANE